MTNSTALTTIRKARQATPFPHGWRQNYRDDDAEFLVNQYRRKQEEPLSSPPPENRTYEYYRRRIHGTAARADGFAAGPRAHAACSVHGQQFRQANLKFSTATMAVTWRSGEPAEYPTSSFSRPRFKKSLLFAGVFAAVAGGAVGFAVTKYDQISKSASDVYAFAVGSAAWRSGNPFQFKPRKRRFPKSPSPLLRLMFPM